MTKLDALFAHLLARARATGQLQSATLHGGARVVVQVKGSQVAVSIGRTPAKVGSTEEVTFRRLFQIPAHARRLPSSGQATKVRDDATWHVIGWTFDEEV